jgi:hypothetical protein
MIGRNSSKNWINLKDTQMKKITTIILMTFTVIALFSQNQTVQPKVDERTELLSIIFRLAEAKEYMNDNIPSYAKEIDEYFAPFKEHETIRFTKKIRSEQGVSYDAVMSIAVALEITDSIRLRPNLSTSCIDQRWGLESATKFIKLLNQFYLDSKFKEFFLKHSTLYKIAEDRFSVDLKDVDFNWFERFYGIKSNGNFNLILSIPNGGGNYGSKVMFNDGKEELYAILGSCRADSSGQPSYSNRVSSTIIHEFNHSFCNPLIDVNYPAMQSITNSMFNLVKETLSTQAYGEAKTMDYEILVRASVIRYSQRNGINEKLLKSQIATEMSNGFLWIDKLVGQLAMYEQNRDKYPTLKDYMPEIVKLENSLSPKQLLIDFEAKCPKIVSISIPTNSENIEPNITEITLTFDRPMSIHNYGVSYGKKGKESYPEFNKDKKAKWNIETKKEWTAYVELKSNRTYSLSFPAQFFKDENGYPLDKTYCLDFTTKKE